MHKPPIHPFPWRAERSGAPPLTRREREVLELLAAGQTNAEIGRTLGISLDGAKWHVAEVLARLDADSRVEVSRWWQQTAA